MAKDRVEIELDPKITKKSETRVTNQVKKLGKKSGEKFSSGFKESSDSQKGLAGSFTKLAKRFAAAFVALKALQGLKDIAVASIKTSAAFEQINTKLKTLTGSAEAANFVFKDLKKFSAETPFKLQDIANASAKLIAFGESSFTVKNRIKEIGEVAAGAGAGLGEVALIFGQVSAAGKLTGERLLQLEERAIPIGPAIAKTMGRAESSIRDLISQGKVSAETFKKAFRSLSQEGGLFEGALAAQSKTLNGLLSTLGDNFDLLKGSIGDVFGPAVKESVSALIGAIQLFGNYVKENGPGIASTLKEIGSFLLVEPVKFWSDFFFGKATGDAAAKSIANVNEELETLQPLLADAEKRLQSSRSLIGRDAAGVRANQLKIFSDLAERVGNLTKERTRLLEVQRKNSDEYRQELKLQEASRQERIRQAAAISAEEKARTNLGVIGLTAEQKLRFERKKSLELIQKAEEKATSGARLREQSRRQKRIKDVISVEKSVNAALTKVRSEFSARRAVVDQEFQDRLNKIKFKSIGDLGLTEEKALREKFTRDQGSINASVLAEKEKKSRLLVIEQKFNEDLRKIQDAELAKSQESPTFDNIAAAFKKTAEETKITAKDVAKTVQNTMVNGFGNAFEAFGSALASGGNGLKEFGKTVLSSIGQLASTLGSFFILIGAGLSSTTALLGISGGSAIAAGVGLKILGGVLSGLAGSSSGGGATAGGSAGASSSSQDLPAETALAEPEERTARSNINVNIDTMLDSEESGLRLVEILNNTFESQGAIIRTNIA
jgi:tape measure domain-containing protein